MTITKDLRTLAQEFASGILDHENYRKHRRKLISDITAGKVKVEEREYLPPVDFSDGDSTSETVINFQTEENNKPDDSPPPSHDQPKPGTSHSHDVIYKWLLAGGVIALICLIGLFVMVIIDTSERRTDTPQQSTTESTMSNVTQTVSPVIQPETGTKLIESFLTSNDWSDENMQSFLSEWRTLNQEEKIAGLQSTSMRRLNSAIHQQFQEQKALLILGDDTAVIEKQQALISFAEELGIRDPRLKLGQ